MNKPEWTVGAGDAGRRLDAYLASVDRLGSRNQATTALERGKVFVNGAEASADDGARRLIEGDIVQVWIDRPGSAKSRPRTGQVGHLIIIYEDDDLLVLNKPAGLLTIPLERKHASPSLYDQVSDRLRSHGKRRPFVVHRIDQDTSGVVIFAKTREAQRALQIQFRRREPERVYLAVVHGRVQPSSGIWRDHLVWSTKALIQRPARPREDRSTEAISDYRVVEAFAEASLIEVRLRTGRRNQIRLQAQLRGHSLVGEKRYADGGDTPASIRFKRQALHAFRVAFNHPVSGTRLELEAPLPPDLSDLLDRLRRRPISRRRESSPLPQTRRANTRR